MSVLAVNEIEPNTGTVLAVVPGNSLEADQVNTDILGAKTSTGLVVSPGVTLRGNDASFDAISGQSLSVDTFLNADSIATVTASFELATVIGSLNSSGSGTTFSAPATLNTVVTHGASTLTSGANVNIDFTTRNVFSLTLSHNPTFTFTGGSLTPALLYLDPNGASRTLNWPGGVKWSGTALTTLTSGNLYVVTISRVGSTYILASTEFI